MTSALLALRDVCVHYPARGVGRQHGSVRAVDGVSLHLAPGETLGLVGESGCGKTTLARAVLRLIDSTGGGIDFDGRDVTHLSGRALFDVRRQIQVVLQDPYASLNPRMRVRDNIAEPLITHRVVPRGRRGRSEIRRQVSDLLVAVGLDPSVQDRYPHEFSGGQRQRIGIARALALHPRVVICDEAVSALDVSVQAQILQLLRRLQNERGLSYLFVSHDLGVMRQIADRVAVMYLGRIVEIAPTEELFTNPRHPYTHALLSAAPVADPSVERVRRRIVLAGDPPSPVNPPSGCAFHTRCPVAQARCAEVRPPLVATQEGASHELACFYPVESVTELVAAQQERAPE